MYMEKHRQQTGKNGVELVSILHYLKNHKSYVGTVQAHRFETTNTSAYVFRYGDDWLNVNLDRTIKDTFSSAKTESEKSAPKKIEEPPPDLFAEEPEPPFWHDNWKIK